MFNEKEKSTLKYWFAHWCAYQMTALNCKAWKFKYLFHDIEKPLLELLWKDHKKVKTWHRNHNTHHIEYPGKRKKDYEAMMIDWECSRFTKTFRVRGAREELDRKYLDLKIMTDSEYLYCKEILNKFGL